MKYFALLSGEEIHPAGDDKIIPSEQYVQLQEASTILDTVQRDAAAYRHQVIVECETLKEQAYQEGFSSGLEQFDTHLLHMDKLLKTLREEIHKKVLPIALKAAKKILGEELQLHPERIIDIVIQALKPVIQHHQIRIYVNKVDLPLLEEQRKTIKSHLEQVESFSIQERMDVQPGGCIIETEAGIINAQLDNQWRAMEIAFQAFMTPSP